MSQHEPRLAGSIAYAACSDVELRLAPATSNSTIRRLFTDVTNFVKQSSPKTHVANTNCPVFLFHAADDSNVPLSESQAYEQQLKAVGKTVEFRTVPTGNHYDSMVKRGVPMAVQWLKKQTGIAPDSGPPTGPAQATGPNRRPKPNTPSPGPAPKNAGWPE
jgi:dipeptidyl aminopeptidase/acylaminoacyl peptidase